MSNAIEDIFSKILGGSKNQKELRKLRLRIGEINSIAERYKSLTDDELKAKTQEFKYRLRMGETLDDLLPEAFAAVKDTCRRLLGAKWIVRGHETEWNMVPYDVQLMGGIVLHEGKIAEMATGEGKTLVATMPLYLNALAGRGAHLITVNEYLAQRDCEWMGKIYEFLGLRAAALINDMAPDEKRQGYNADITYGTNNEFGFDYLRDNMAVDVWSVVQRGLVYAIVDEVDSVLIDEARTPLIISGAVGAPRNVYNELRPIVANLYRRQKELVDELVSEGKKLLEQDEERGGLMLLRALRGDPKNQALLDTLTSEFWVKKLIEHIQGQYEINKTMSEVDAELYYTIDEKSHVLDITEKGRTFLSGGRDQDIVAKIKQLDEIDERLAHLSEQKNFERYFVTDPLAGLCNGFSLEGKVRLCRTGDAVKDEEFAALNKLDERLRQLHQHILQQVQTTRIDKASAWRSYFQIAKKADRIVDGLTDSGLAFLKEPNEAGAAVDGLVRLFGLLQSEANVADDHVDRHLQDNRKLLQETFFVCDNQLGCPVALTEAGKAAIVALNHDGNPLLLPFIQKMDALLKQNGVAPEDSGSQPRQESAESATERVREFFEFAHNGTAVRNVTEKGRIAVLGGNPEIYVLPDRSIVEQRDREIQQLLDATLNQSSFDYTARVGAVEELEKDIRNIGDYITSRLASGPPDAVERFYHVAVQGPVENQTIAVELTDAGKAFISNFAEQTRDIVYGLDEDIRKFKADPTKLFQQNDDGHLLDLSQAERDRLLGASFSQTESKIKEWKEKRASEQNENPVNLRLSLDEFLNSNGDLDEPADASVSLSRRFEEIDRITRVLRVLCNNIGRTDLSVQEKIRLAKRYFILSGEAQAESEWKLQVSGLSDAGIRVLLGDAEDRLYVAEQLFVIMGDENIDVKAIFEFAGEGFPKGLCKAARSRLIGGLPFFSFESELRTFREEILRMSAKKVNTRGELDSILPREKAQLRAKRFMLDEGEMNELIARAHAPNSVITNEDIEHWCRLHFERKPRRVLENRRDRLWREYNEIEERIQNISQLLRAYTLYHKDVDYVVKVIEENEMRGRHASARGNKAVMIVDQFTGRLMPGRRFSDGLHEALEAKEGVEVQAESQTLATVTIQNFFRIYEKLAGMTGTAETESQEFFSTYKLDVVVIPTNRPVVRGDHNDVIFRTKREKYEAVIDEAIRMHDDGRPVLIGTISVDVSQKLSQMFTQRGVPIANWLKKGDVNRELESGRFHTVLNAKFHQMEAEIVMKARLPGSITIATNMAGRGTDIKLAPGVVERGGLHILGSEKHEARRIDRQLRGRSGRQGDPGSSRFYLSLEDDLMRLFGSDRIAGIMSRLGPAEEGERIEHPLITRSIERAQKKVEERNFDIRKNLLQYDDVLNEQRKIIYKRRQNLLGFAKSEEYVESKAKMFFNEEDDRSEWKLASLLDDLHRYFNRRPDFEVESFDKLNHAQIKETIHDWVEERINEEKHYHELQIRHRIFGYCAPDSLLEELVRMKIRLHSAGSTDVLNWNFEGIRYELGRIFDIAPEEIGDSLKQQERKIVEEQLIALARKTYRQRYEQAVGDFRYVTFASLDMNEMIDIYIDGLMSFYLNPSVPAISWNVDEFLSGLERLYGSTPQLGANEIRSIRRDKLIDFIREWRETQTLDAQDDVAYRHRILGYFSLHDFAAAVADYCLNISPEGNGREHIQLTSDQKVFLQRAFGQDIAARFEEQKGYSTGEIVSIVRQFYLEQLDEKIAAYDVVMISSASIEEIIEASVVAICRDILKSSVEPQEKQKRISQNIGNIFLQKPQKALPAGADQHEMASYIEDMVAWVLDLYEEYAFREERLRQERLSGEIVRDSVLMVIDDAVYKIISDALGGGSDLDAAMLSRIESDCRLVLRQSPRIIDDSDEIADPNDVLNRLSKWAKDLYYKRVREIGNHLAVRYERYYILEKIDENWRQHLNAIDELREGIGLRGYGQKDPLLEYKSEGYKMFVQMIDRINRDIAGTLFKVFDIGGELEEQQARRIEPKEFRTSHSQIEVFKQAMAGRQTEQASVQQPGTMPRRRTVVKTSHVGRNQPCPCGSGKKYKNCCGKNA